MPTATNGLQAESSTSTTPSEAPSTSVTAPPSVLEVLKAFQETQQRRVAHWAEYDEALNAFMAQSSGRGSMAGGPVGGSRNDAGEIRRRREVDGEGEQAAGSGHRCCGRGPANAPSDGEPDAQAPTPFTEELMTRILGLVTSGLLDCGHTTRALSSELKSGNDHFSARPDLARMLSDIQELENKLLRGVVKRDQARRRERVEGRDLQDEIGAAQAEVDGCKREIGEAMEEVSAEVAELIAAED